MNSINTEILTVFFSVSRKNVGCFSASDILKYRPTPAIKTKIAVGFHRLGFQRPIL